MAVKRNKSGLYGLMAKVSSKGLSALDKRSAGSRALQLWRCELERDLGGTDSLSAQQRTIIELASRVRLYLDFVDQYIFSLSSVVIRRRKTVIPIFLQRMQLSDSLARLLTQLGLSKRMPPTPSLPEYLRQAYPDREHIGNPATEETDEPEASEANSPNLDGIESEPRDGDE